MSNFFEGLFPIIFIHYLMYALQFFFALIPIFSQILFLKFMKIKNLPMIGVTIFLTEGLLIILASILVEVLTNYCTMFSFVWILLLTVIFFFISYGLGRVESKVNWRGTIIILVSFALNTAILYILILKFELFVFI